MERLPDDIISEIKARPYTRFTTNNRELMIRCPFCGDSIKHANSTHLYIKVMNEQPNNPFPYYCQRCKATGIVDSDFLKMLQIFSTELLVTMNKYNKTLVKSNKIKLASKTKLKLPEYEDNKLNRVKLNYINKRLGTNLTYKDLSKYKIILNLYDVLDLNGITSLTCKDSMGDILDRNFIGFVSYDNNFIIMRNLSKKTLANMRYYNYNIYGNYENSKRFYVMPNDVDVLNPTVKVIATEGIFDILGVYFNVKDQDKNSNTIYTAICGTGYNNVIKQFAKMGFLEQDIHIYSDADQKIKSYNYVKSDIEDYIDGDLDIYYNKLEKDFGVTKEQIELTHTRI